MHQVLISGVHNSLAKAATYGGLPDRAEQHFAASLRTVMPMQSGKLQIDMRRETQLSGFESFNPPT
jgi:hypothetical protein